MSLATPRVGFRAIAGQKRRVELPQAAERESIMGLTHDMLRYFGIIPAAFGTPDAFPVFPNYYLQGPNGDLPSITRSILGSDAVSAATGTGGTEVVLTEISIETNALKAGTILDFEAYLTVTATVGTPTTARYTLRFGGLTGDILYDSVAAVVANGNYIHLRGSIELRDDPNASTDYVAITSGYRNIVSTAAAIIPTVVTDTIDLTGATVKLSLTETWSVTYTGSNDKTTVKRLTLATRQSANVS